MPVVQEKKSLGVADSTSRVDHALNITQVEEMSKLFPTRQDTGRALPVNLSFLYGAGRLPRFLVPTTVLSMARGAAAACVDTECAPAGGWDNFANNLGSDLAPLLALFGEQVTKQYMSESLSKTDNILFALAPLGIITAIVSAIRVSDSTKLRGLIGRSMESRGEVEADLMSSTSPDVCELWSGNGVVRVLGRPHLLHLVRVGSGSSIGDSVELYTFQDAIHQGLYMQKGCEVNGATNDQSTLDRGLEELRNRQAPPNLSLNVSTKPLPKMAMVILVIVGAVVQGGVLAFAAVVQYTLKLKKNDLPPITSAFPVFVAGTVFLGVGMFLCAQVVELSSEEVTYLPAGDDKTVIWLQQGGQTVGDQRFGSFARRTENATIITSQKSKKTARFDLVLMGIGSTLLGFISQFVALRQMHSTVTVAQLGAVLVMTIIRSSAHIQRHTGNDIKTPDEIEGHELDWLAKDLHGCTAWHVLSVRVLPASAGRTTITPPTPISFGNTGGRGHWLLGHLGISWLRRHLTSLETPQESIALNNRSAGTIVSQDIATAVMQTRARLASFSQTWDLQDRTQVRILQNAIEAGMGVIYSKMTLQGTWKTKQEFTWTIAVHAQADPAAVSNVELTMKRVADQNGGWRPWIIVEGQLEAVYCLWVSTLVKEDTKRALDGLSRYNHSRCIDLASEDHIRDYKIWSGRGTISKKSKLSSDTRYFGHPKAFDPAAEYLWTTTDADLGSLCAQHIYAAFISKIVENVVDVSGTTELCVTDSSAGITTISETKYDGWARLRPKNSNIDSLAMSYHESQLGTIEEAYCTITPALRNRGLIPNVVPNARESAKIFEREERWIASMSLDQWIYSNVGPGNPDRLELNAEIENRRVRLTEWLLKRATAIPESTELWDAAYLACQDIPPTSSARVVGLLNLWKSQKRLQYPTDPEEIFLSTFAAAKALCDEGRYSLHILIEFLTFAIAEGRHTAVESIATSVYHGLSSERNGKAAEVLRAVRQKMNVFMHIDGLQSYFDNPTCLQRAAMQEVESSICGEPAEPPVPLDLLLIKKWRTPLQAAAGAGRLEVVKQLFNCGANVDARPATSGGRTALQAAAESGNSEIVDLLLIELADVNAEPAKSDGKTALQAAAGAGHIAIVQRLLDEYAFAEARPSENGRSALQAAAGEGHLKIVSLLIDQSDPDQPAARKGGRTGFQAAVEAGHLKIMKLLIEHSASVNTDPATHFGRTVLQAAAGAGHVDIVRDLLKIQLADVNDKPSSLGGRTALQAAAEGGHLAVMEVLLEYEVEVNGAPAEREGRTALQAAAEAGHIQMVKRLLASGAEVNAEGSEWGGRTALQGAAGSGHLDIVKILWENAAQINAEPSDMEGRTAIQAAAEAGKPVLVEWLLEKGAYVNDRRIKVDGFTSLQLAARAGHLDIVHLLLANDAEIDAAPSFFGRTALQAAAEAGHLDIINVLLEKGATVNAAPGTSNGRTALQAAAEAGHLDIVQLLLDKGADVNAAPSEYNGQPALQAAARAGHLDVTEALLKENVDVNAVPTMKDGRTALQAAAESGQLDVLKRLLKKGAEVNAPATPNGRTALQAAAEAGPLDVVEWLCQNGAEVNAAPGETEGRTAFQAAAGAGFLDVLKYLCQKGADVNAPPTPHGRTALQAAAEAGSVNVVEWLVENNAEVNAEAATETGRTALQAAAGAGHLDVVAWLLENGAEVNGAPAENMGRTALQAAAGAGHIDVVMWLLHVGADINAAPGKENGMTALQAAVYHGYLLVVSYLLKRGADYTARLWNNSSIFELGSDPEILELLKSTHRKKNPDSSNVL